MRYYPSTSTTQTLYGTSFSLYYRHKCNLNCTNKTYLLKSTVCKIIMWTSRTTKGKESLGFIYIGQWVKVKGGGLEVMERITRCSAVWAGVTVPREAWEKQEKTHTTFYLHTQTPLSFNDAIRAWKGITVRLACNWKKQFFSAVMGKNLAWALKLPFPPPSPFPLLYFFYYLFPLALLSAVLNAGQVLRAHRPSLLLTEKSSEWGRVLFLPISSQSQLPAKTSPTCWPHSGCLPILFCHSALSQYSTIFREN